MTRVAEIDTSRTKASDASGPRARGRPNKRGQKREALLEGATALFNAQGISATNLAEVAEAVGLTRATVYYYVKDRAELVFHCYRRACELVAADLEAASRAETGLERTLEFIRLSLTPERAPSAVLTEINSLAPAHAGVIREANNQNTAHLFGFLEEGMRDGSIRGCDSEIVGQAIVGMLAWAQLLPHWSRRDHAPTLRARTSQTMIDLLTNGLSKDRRREFRCHVTAEAFQPTLSNAFDRRESSSIKLEQVLATASKLFNRNGIEATSLDEIADAMGVSKGVFYHYLDDKSHLVTRCYERSFDLYDHFVDAAEGAGENGLDAALINAHLNIQAQVGALSPLMPQPGFESVPEPSRAILHARAARQNKMVADLLRRGVEQGIARPVDAPLVTHIAAGAFGWLPKWLPPDGDHRPAEVADKICRILLLGLRPR